MERDHKAAEQAARKEEEAKTAAAVTPGETANTGEQEVSQVSNPDSSHNLLAHGAVSVSLPIIAFATCCCVPQLSHSKAAFSVADLFFCLPLSIFLNFFTCFFAFFCCYAIDSSSRQMGC